MEASVLLLKHRWVERKIPVALALQDAAREKYSTADHGRLELDDGSEE
jgi:hypothetical protein